MINKKLLTARKVRLHLKEIEDGQRLIKKHEKMLEYHTKRINERITALKQAVRARQAFVERAERMLRND